MKIEEFIEVDKETGTQNLLYCWYSVHLQFFFGAISGNLFNF